MTNKFGGSWTFQKIRIVEEYAKAYLQIMKEHPYWKLMYFDGFAGTGEFGVKQPRKQLPLDGLMNEEPFDGAAKKIVSISEPKPFDMCYFVELEEAKAQLLKERLEQIRNRGVYVVTDDCNKKIISLAQFLRGELGDEGKKFKVLAFIDPYGMNVEWSSIEAMRDLGIDMWILAPTGIGANRLLKRNGDVPDEWATKLEAFFGVPKEKVYQSIYTENTIKDFFGNVTTTVNKNRRAINEIHNLYSDRLKTVFKFVSEPYVMKNSINSTMYHLYLASNNTTAIKIANHIVRKYNIMK